MDTDEFSELLRRKAEEVPESVSVDPMPALVAVRRTRRRRRRALTGVAAGAVLIAGLGVVDRHATEAPAAERIDLNTFVTAETLTVPIRIGALVDGQPIAAELGRNRTSLTVDLPKGSVVRVGLVCDTTETLTARFDAKPGPTISRQGVTTELACTATPSYKDWTVPISGRFVLTLQLRKADGSRPADPVNGRLLIAPFVPPK
ncbi:hypothetical protein BWI15_28330 [Kribbella sp. ALI-6-A]|uniref:hypothetical protein n=1 Tax=Kribbella sp. ALI-6-A TaxID=1933817 RepID=UPI00097CBD31|nr:hypothetical protein [Kribbella sp. ALI-6-A]ONI67085.1 hypothetical protein BWI15_28330 [Kribbella sp. ALI-6-A]